MRDAIIVALALVGVYLLFSLLKLAQIKLRQRWPRRVKVRKEPVVKGDKIVIGQRMSLTLSCDHRVVDGAVGARLMQAPRTAPVALAAPALLPGLPWLSRAFSPSRFPGLKPGAPANKQLQSPKN